MSLSLSSFVFPGYPAYLEAAANQFGRPESARAAGRLLAVTALANLCAQASRADLAHVGAILAKGVEFRDQLAIALQAADAMLDDVKAARIAPENAPGPELLDDDLVEASVGRRVAPRKPAKGASS